MLRPDYIKFEKPKNELYLTFSAIPCKDSIENILDIQKDIEGIIKNNKGLKCIDFLNKKEDLHKRISNLYRGKFIYRYPKDTFHFSIVNFATYDIVSLNDFEIARKNIERTDNFIELREEIKNFKKRFEAVVLENKSNEFTVEIRRIFLPGGIENSLALNVFPTDENFFKNLECITKEAEGRINKKFLTHDLKIKAHPEKSPAYFVLNLFRFIDKEESYFEQQNFYEEIEKINKNLKENFIKIKAKIRIVVSDPYLSNPNPWIKWGFRDLYKFFLIFFHCLIKASK